MRANWARRRLCIMAVLAMVVGAAFYCFAYSPQCDTLRAKEAETASLRREIGKAVAFRRSHPEPAKEAKMMGSRKRVVDAMLPSRLETGAFLAETEKRAAASGVVLLGVAPGDAETAGGLAREKMRLSVSGDYFALLDFLYALEQQSRFVRIDAMRGTVESGTFTGAIELWIYARAI